MDRKKTKLERQLRLQRLAKSGGPAYKVGLGSAEDATAAPQSLAVHLENATFSRGLRSVAPASKWGELQPFGRAVTYGFLGMVSATTAWAALTAALTFGLGWALGSTTEAFGLSYLPAFLYVAFIFVVAMVRESHVSLDDVFAPRTRAFGGVDVADMAFQSMSRLASYTDALVDTRLERGRDEVVWGVETLMPGGETVRVALSQGRWTGSFEVELNRGGVVRGKRSRAWTRAGKEWTLEEPEGSRVVVRSIEPNLLGELDTFLTTHVGAPTLAPKDYTPGIVPSLSAGFVPAPEGVHAVELSFGELAEGVESTAMDGFDRARQVYKRSARWRTLLLYSLQGALGMAVPFLGAMVAYLFTLTTLEELGAPGPIGVYILGIVLAAIGTACWSLPQLLGRHPQLPRLAPRAQKTSRHPALRFDGTALTLEGNTIALDKPFGFQMTRAPTAGSWERARVVMELVQSGEDRTHRIALAVDVLSTLPLQRLDLLERQACLVPEAEFFEWVWPAISYGLSVHGVRPRINFKPRVERAAEPEDGAFLPEVAPPPVVEASGDVDDEQRVPHTAEVVATS